MHSSAATGKPTIWAQGYDYNAAFRSVGQLLIEINWKAPYVKADSQGGVSLVGDTYFEGWKDQTHVADHAQLYVEGVGGVVIDGAWFGANGNNLSGAVKLGGNPVGDAVGPRISNSGFHMFPGSATLIEFTTSSFYAQLNNVAIRAPGQTGPVIEFKSHSGMISDVFIQGGGPLKTTGGRISLSNIVRYNSSVPAGEYHFDLTDQCVLNGAIIYSPNSAGHGVKAAGATVNGLRITALNGGNGIESTSANDVISNNHVSGISGGTPLVYVNGTKAWNNIDDTSDEATATNGAATLNKEAGTITTDSLTTGPGGDYLLTLTNSMVSTGSIVHATLNYGDLGFNTVSPAILHQVTPQNGSVKFVIHNGNANTNFNGIIKVNFHIRNR